VVEDLGQLIQPPQPSLGRRIEPSYTCNVAHIKIGFSLVNATRPKSIEEHSRKKDNTSTSPDGLPMGPTIESVRSPTQIYYSNFNVDRWEWCFLYLDMYTYKYKILYMQREIED
jgi:hypothetical protein